MISGSRTGGGAGGLRGPKRTKLRRRLPRANDRQLRARVRGFNTPAIFAVISVHNVTGGAPTFCELRPIVRIGGRRR